jgi:serine/threonine protein kinase
MASIMPSQRSFIAPEILMGKPYGPQPDVWSAGVILYSESPRATRTHIHMHMHKYSDSSCSKPAPISSEPSVPLLTNAVLLGGTYPFAHENRDVLFDLIKRGTYNFDLDTFRDVSDDAKVRDAPPRGACCPLHGPYPSPRRYKHTDKHPSWPLFTPLDETHRT